MGEYLVDIQHERLSFFTPAGEVKALNDVSIRMKEGEVLGIVGESGSGKSVTAYSIMGLTAENGKIMGGSVEFNGHRIDKMSEQELRKIRGKEVSLIFQDPMTSLNPVYTIGNQIKEVLKLHVNMKGKEAYDRAVELLTLVGINEPENRMKQYPHEHSGGMRQRVMIAMALACEPKLLIADEPTTALDVTIRAQILELMQELKKKLGMGIIDRGVRDLGRYFLPAETRIHQGPAPVDSQVLRTGIREAGSDRRTACGPSQSAERMSVCSQMRILHEDLSERKTRSDF